METVEVWVDEQMPDGGEHALLACLAELGLPAAGSTREAPSHRGVLTDLGWQVLLILPIHALLTGIGANLGTDLYHRLVRAVRELTDRRPKPLVLLDATTGAKIILDRDLPDHAYRHLAALRPQPGTTYRYDRNRDEWRATDAEGGRHGENI